eukprot:CAMPEP_0202973784 /NCGR_PEP_ID=MMETSP1396-20130829/53978_1 /ASSEMBLY_ACC=CAM_ASM_000872 /TAXON_ID= /ORGANISM="Pseudokeronopsis sp., Strain Brazil" /LENGTH=101 /DNA_ID=CAMNT_0049706459 /DNA_START=309 /DNA_END=611 /DNA_ORIENTATION=-
MEEKESYRTNHMFVVMGGDFCFMNGKMYFDSVDKLINYFNNKHDDVTLMYSTPSIYVDAIKEAGVEFPTKYDDFWPYADNDTSMWTGFYTSRANDKEYIRR